MVKLILTRTLREPLPVTCEAGLGFKTLTQVVHVSGTRKLLRESPDKPAYTDALTAGALVWGAPVV